MDRAGSGSRRNGRCEQRQRSDLWRRGHFLYSSLRIDAGYPHLWRSLRGELVVMAKIFITSGTSWAGVATDGTDIIVECIGAGGGGATAASNIGTGGGGGAYAVKTVPYTSNASVSG